MRSASIVLALAMVMGAAASFLPSNARALEPPKLSVFFEAGVGNDTIFSLKTIVLPSVPIILNVTIINNSTGPPSPPMAHTFSIRDNTPATRIQIWVNTTGARASVEFAVNSTKEIYYGGQLFQAESSNAGGIKFFCFPHEQAVMVGNIVVGGVSTPQSPELGIFLRAYWIGIIGLVAMLVWTVITYFIIKATSRHHADHSEHIRRGLT